MIIYVRYSVMHTIEIKLSRTWNQIEKPVGS